MRQKFMLFQDPSTNVLKIREYAILDKSLKKVQTALLRPEHYALLCEETYDGERIVDGISRGREALMGTLRTGNLFPIQPYARKIAESVAALYEDAGRTSAELFFDDVELVATQEV